MIFPTFIRIYTYVAMLCYACVLTIQTSLFIKPSVRPFVHASETLSTDFSAVRMFRSSIYTFKRQFFPSFSSLSTDIYFLYGNHEQTSMHSLCLPACTYQACKFH